MDQDNLIVVHSPCIEVSPERVRRVNPFEQRNLDNLQYPFWSPSVFDNVSMEATPPQNTWTIDQLAVLFPKPIEDSPSSHRNEYVVDSATEAKAQADIDKFFSSGIIAPSPENVPSNSRGGPLPLRKTVSMPSYSKRHAWTMTHLALPTVLPTSMETELAPYVQMEVISGSEPCHISPIQSDSNSGSGLDEDMNIPRISVRRRLDLSFGEYQELEGTSNQTAPQNLSIPYGDPFGSNHKMISPSARPSSSQSSPMEISTTELADQFKRCEFTPDGKDRSLSSPEITPIREDDQNDKPKTPLGSWNHQKKEQEDKWSFSSTPTSLRSTSNRSGGFRRRKVSPVTNVENQDLSTAVFSRAIRRFYSNSSPEQFNSPPPPKIPRSGNN